MASDFDELVFDAIRGHTEEQPQDLVGILGFVDGREKLVLTQEELAGALQRLIDARRIGECSRHRFYELNDPSVSVAFSGLTPEEHAAACECYRQEFWRRYRELSGE